MAAKKKAAKRGKKRSAVKDLSSKSATSVKGGALTGTGKTVKIQFLQP